MSELQATIEQAFERRAELSPASASAQIQSAVAQVLAGLDTGRLRVAEKRDGQWITHQWLKMAVLLSFRLRDNGLMQGGYTRYFDKVDSKFANYTHGNFQAGGYRVVPPASVRHGAFIAKNVVLMPSYVNVGAYVDEGTMVDTWATVGSCAQIGRNVHLSGGVGIGGVLEPLQANPTIIEDGCFIGATERDRRGRDRGRGLRGVDGRLCRPEHEDLQPRHGRGVLREIPPGSVVVSAAACPGATAGIVSTAR